MSMCLYSSDVVGGIFIFKEPVSPVLLAGGTRIAVHILRICHVSPAGIVFTLMGSMHYVVATTRRRGWENKLHEK